MAIIAIIDKLKFLWRLFRVTILSKNLSKNLAMNLQAHTRLQHLTFFRHMHRRRSRRRRRCVGRDARVPWRCSRRVRGPPPAGSCSAAPLGTWMHILYQPFQLNPTCIGTACADLSNITFSDRILGCFGWNSSPSQCCASRSVHAHHISAIDIL